MSTLSLGVLLPLAASRMTGQRFPVSSDRETAERASAPLAGALGPPAGGTGAWAGR